MHTNWDLGQEKKREQCDPYCPRWRGQVCSRPPAQTAPRQSSSSSPFASPPASVTREIRQPYCWVRSDKQKKVLLILNKNFLLEFNFKNFIKDGSWKIQMAAVVSPSGNVFPDLVCISFDIQDIWCFTDPSIGILRGLSDLADPAGQVLQRVGCHVQSLNRVRWQVLGVDCEDVWP